MNPGRVTAVIPSYNYGRFVAEAVESALAQTHPVEVVVVDDGSTDDTAGRLEPYRGRIRVIRQENRGLSAARNTGIRESTGEWVALLDADDAWHPEKIEAQLEAIGDDPEVALVGSPSGWDRSGGALGRARARRLGVADFLMRAPFGPSSALIRRGAWEAVGPFDERLKAAEDRDMWLRLSARFAAAEVPLACWHYRSHPGQMSRDPALTFAYYRTLLIRFFDEHPEHASHASRAFAYLDVDAALCHLDRGERAMALRFLARSLARWPRPLRDPRRPDPLWRAKLVVRAALGEAAIRRLPKPGAGAVPARPTMVPEGVPA